LFRACHLIWTVGRNDRDGPVDAHFTDRVNRASMHGRFWSPSYFAASCGGAPLAIIRQYVDQQRRPD
jgi:REP element-mobilizing transposase RayT